MPKQHLATATLAALGLGLPFVLVSWGTQALVTPVSRHAACALGLVGDALRTAVEDPTPELEAPSEADHAVVDVLEPPLRKPRPPAASKRAAITPAPPAALFVSARKVLELSNGSARPRGAFVPPSEVRPGGLRLSGVTALGIGLQDGDILIEALGAAPRSPGQVIGAILEARARQARSLSGKLWRGGRVIPITVEQPYLRAP